MAYQVLEVGNCSFDHTKLRRLIESNFDARISRAHLQTEAIELLRGGRFELVLVNRIIDRDDSEGLDLIAKIKADPHLRATPVMLISDFEHYQQQAVAAGAEPGFGKSALDAQETRQQLARFLNAESGVAASCVG
jgi:CheY-like chemotaxis protein